MQKHLKSSIPISSAYDFLIMRQGIDGVAQKSIDFWRPLQAESQKASQNRYKGNKYNKFKRRSNMKPDQANKNRAGKPNESNFAKKENN